MIGHEGVTGPETVVGFQRCLRLALGNRDFAGDSDKLSGLVQMADARALDDLHERLCAAVHDRDFLVGEFDADVVDAETPKRGHEVFDRSDLYAALADARRQRRVGDVLRPGPNEPSRHVQAVEFDSRIGIGGTKRHTDGTPAMYADPDCVGGTVDCSLTQHWLSRPSPWSEVNYTCKRPKNEEKMEAR